MRTEVLYRAGARETGNTVCLVRRGGVSRSLYLRWWDPTLRQGKGDYVWTSLDTEDIEVGMDAADDAAKVRRKGLNPRQGEEGPRVVTVALLFGLYEEAKHLPRVGPRGERIAAVKKARQIKADAHRMSLWQSYLTAGRDVLTVDADDLTGYVEWRRLSGVSDTTIGHEITFFRGVCEWATAKRLPGEPEPLLRFHPVKKERGERRLRSANPNKPEMGADRFLRIYRQADRVDPQQLLRPLLMIVREHGWRLSAWCEIWASDFDLTPRVMREAGKVVVWPDGAVRKRAANDKVGKPDKWIPLTPRSRRAAARLLRRAGVIGNAPVFRAPRKGGPWQPQHALDLLHRAELAVCHAERLDFLRRVAPEVSARVRVRIGRAALPLPEYLQRHARRVEAGLEHCADLVRQVNEAMGWEWRAEIEPEPGFGFHSLRRTWGKERKTEPLVDVAEAGDWDPSTLLNFYQTADPETTLRVVRRARK